MEFTIRCSAIAQIMGGAVGLTEKQAETLTILSTRKADPSQKPLTSNMETELVDLKEKQANPELPQGAKTYCKKWLKQQEFQRWPELKNKYIEKGNTTEADGVTLTCVQLKLGMVKENTERRNNGFIEGCIDYLVDGVIYDNKSSWDLETFPMYETQPNPDYVWQLNGYMELWDCHKSILVHTLNDAPEKMLFDATRWYDDYAAKAAIIKNMVFTERGWKHAATLFFDALPVTMYPTFVPIPDEKRIKTFPIMRDNIKIGAVYQRRNMCNSYINSLITNSNQNG